MTSRLLQRVESLVRGLPADRFLRSDGAIHLTSAIDAGFPQIWTNDRHLIEDASLAWASGAVR
jgi:hypothetical protein